MKKTGLALVASILILGGCESKQSGELVLLGALSAGILCFGAQVC